MRRDIARSRGAASDPNAPHLRALFEVIPCELVLILSLKLIVKRSRLVIIDQHERLTGLEPCKALEDESMTIARGKPRFDRSRGYDDSGIDSPGPR